MPDVSDSIGIPVSLASQAEDISRLTRLLLPNILPEHLPHHVHLSGDHLGLLEIDDVYQKVLGHGYVQAINLIEHILPSMDRHDRRAWRRGEPLVLPEQHLGDFYSYRMAVDHNLSTGVGNIHFYRSDDPSITDRGFSIHRFDGHFLLRDKKRGNIDTSDDELYKQTVSQALQAIYDYAERFGLQPEALRQPPVQLTQRERVARFVSATLKAIDHLPFRSRAASLELSEHSYSNKVKRFGWTAIAITTLPLVVMNADDIINASEHSRAGFDAQNFHLSEGYATAIMNGEPIVMAFDPNLSKAILQAPIAEMMSGSRQDVVGGVRRINGKRSDDILPNTCGNINVRVQPQSTVRAVTTNPAWVNKLNVSMTPNNIIVCNTSDQTSSSGIEDIFFEVEP